MSQQSPRSHICRRPWCLPAALALLALTGCRQPPEQISQAAAAAPKPTGPKTFGGPVLEVNTKENWFVMRGGGSQRYARVKILLDKKTKWTGLPVENRMPKVNQVVRVQTAAPKGDDFPAVTVHVHDPNERPQLGGASPM